MEQVHEIAKVIPGTVKNAADAKALLQTKGWIIPGEPVSQDILARTLFAVTIEHKLPPAAANAITAAAYLITESLEEGIKQGIANMVTSTVIDHLRDSVDAMTEEIKQKIDSHARALEETAQTQTTITQDMQKTQELLTESAQQAASQVRTYSQAASTPARPHSPSPPPALSHSQLQIQNREQIKRRQVLIDFKHTEDLVLDMMDEETLSRKAEDSLRTTWAAVLTPKPTSVKLKSTTLLRNGGLLIELDTSEAAQWLKSVETIDKFLDGIGSGASIKNRTYQVIVQFVPVRFDPTDDAQVRTYEEHNNIPQNSVLKAEWIKPVNERRTGQKVATMRVYHRDADSANTILKHGAYVFNKRVEPKRPRKEPIRCLRCQRFGHERRECKSNNAYCGKCSGTHETNTCRIPRDDFKCVNCFRAHPSYDRDCGKFWEKCKQMDQRCPENGLAFYPTDEQWTWVTAEHGAATQPPPPVTSPPRPPQTRQTMRQTLLTGSNDTPLGPNRNQVQQSHDAPSQ